MEEPIPVVESEGLDAGLNEALDEALNEAQEIPDRGEIIKAEAENVSGVKEEELERLGSEEETLETPEEASAETGCDAAAAPDVENLIEPSQSPSGSTRDEDDVDDGMKDEGSEALEPESVVVEDEHDCTELHQNLKIHAEEQQKLFLQLQAERDELIQRNDQLQAKLTKYFLKTGDKPLSEPDQERLYQDIMEALKQQHQLKERLWNQQVEDLHQQSRQKLEMAQREWRTLASTKHEATVAALTWAKGKAAARVEAQRLQAAEHKCQDELAAVRLENIKLNTERFDMKEPLKTKDALSEGVQQIDFEQLKMENQAYSEKNEERKEELHKLKKTISNTVQILSHVKEKLQLVQTENRLKRERLYESNETAMREEDVLARTKQARDALRSHNLRLQQQCGLLGNPTLLRDLEDTEDERQALETRVEMLSRRHAELSLRCEGTKKKLERSGLLQH